MKLFKKIMIIGVGLIACSGALSAQTRVNIVGSTAFRSAVVKALADRMSGTATFKCVYVNAGGGTFLAPAQVAATNLAFRGTIGGHDTIVKVSFGGSVAGLKAVADQTNINFINDDTLNAAPLGYSKTNSVQVNSAEKAQVCFSDVEQWLVYPDGAHLEGLAVAVIPFQFAVSAAAPAGLTNMDRNKAHANWIGGFPIGTQPAVLYTGNPADANKVVYATGSDDSSGARLTFGFETGIAEYGYISSTSTTTISFPIYQYTVAAVPNFVGNGGYSNILTSSATSSTLVADALKSGNAQLAPYITYLGVADARRAANLDGSGIPAGGAAARLLTYNGQAFSIENVKQGSYTFWNYEYMYNIYLTPFQKDVLGDRWSGGLLQEVLELPTDANGRWINLDDMLSGRNSVGQPVYR